MGISVLLLMVCRVDSLFVCQLEITKSHYVTRFLIVLPALDIAGYVRSKAPFTPAVGFYLINLRALDSFSFGENFHVAGPFSLRVSKFCAVYSPA